MPRGLAKKYLQKDTMSKEQREKYSRAGSVKSEKKARNARDNGLLGGRPKKKHLCVENGGCKSAECDKA